jgi:hypothetical protein
MDTILGYLASVRKALTSAIGVVVTLLTVYHHVSFLPDQPLVASLLGALTVLATWLVPNKTA